jgi:hypothetical protein
MKLVIALIVALSTLPFASVKAVAETKDNTWWTVIGVALSDGENRIVTGNNASGKVYAITQQNSRMYRTLEECDRALLTALDNGWLAERQENLILMKEQGYLSMQCTKISLTGK